MIMDEQLILPLGDVPATTVDTVIVDVPSVTEGNPAEITRIAILGMGSDEPQLHIGVNGGLKIIPLQKVVTIQEIIDILTTLA
jgi:hypothetical protein